MTDTLTDSKPEAQVSAYDAWRADPTPENMGRVLKHLDPVITSEISRFGGGPVLKTKAKTLAIDAVRTYDPAHGAQLRSWVVTQMQPLSRYRQQMQPLRVPEAAARKAADVNRIRSELAETLGYDPTDTELADRIGISVKRINQLRSMSKAVSTESVFAPQGEDDASTLPATDVTFSSMSDAAEEVYKELDDRSRFIYDSSTGSHGKIPISKAEIAKRLGVTPAFVSQQSAAVAERVREAQRILSGG